MASLPNRELMVHQLKVTDGVRHVRCIRSAASAGANRRHIRAARKRGRNGDVDGPDRGTVGQPERVRPRSALAGTRGCAFRAGVRPTDVERWVPSASLLHSNGDAMDIAVIGDRIVGVRGRAVDRVNRGRLGPKDLFGWQANASPDRLTRPLVREGGRLVECDWPTAMGRVVSRSQQLLTERGPGSVGFYTSGQLFLEEYYTLTVLARAGIGTHHLDGNTRLCTATAGEALKESFGTAGLSRRQAS